MNPDAYIEMANAEDTFWWFVGRRKIINASLSKLKFKKKPDILEIGSGTGGNLAMLSQFGRVAAIEKDEWALAFSQNRFSNAVDFIVADFMHHDFKNQKFDLVCAFDVLEHLLDDDRAIHRMIDLVAPEGYLMITVPAFQWLWGKHDQKLHHFRRYNKRSLLSKTKKLPVKIHLFSYFNFLLFPVALLSRFLDSFTGQNFSSTYNQDNVFLNKIFLDIFSVERNLINHINLPFGLSLMVILKYKHQQ